MTTLAETTNGRAAAALVSAAIGCFAIGVFTTLAAASPAFKNLVNFYDPAGPLSGKTTLGVVVWLIAWASLHLLWRAKDVPWGKAMWAAGILLAAGLLLTFPPVFDLFGG